MTIDSRRRIIIDSLVDRVQYLILLLFMVALIAGAILLYAEFNRALHHFLNEMNFVFPSTQL